jgi:hypothetical protein
MVCVSLAIEPWSVIAGGTYGVQIEASRFNIEILGSAASGPRGFSYTLPAS